MRPIKKIDLSTFPLSKDWKGESVSSTKFDDILQWRRDFEASLRAKIEKRDKWLMDVKNQLPCQPMHNYTFQYHAELYWEQLWNMLDTLKEILGDED